MSDESALPFQLDALGVRGRLVRLGPALDAIIERIIFATSRTDQVAAAKALDRVLLWNFYLVPHFNYDKQRYVYWDRFSHPDPLPKYAVSGFPNLWWYDADKAAKLKRS
jgi:microcin C transport system substrate-binding protein